MSSSTIDYGIDLGTTNSAVAVLEGVEPQIIKNNTQGDITPSAVSYDRKGTLRVGHQAKNKVCDTPDDAYVAFKRRMGTDFVYEFKSANLKRKPEELSAEILKSLRGDVRQRSGTDLTAAVITVPAAFQAHQCDATRRAAQLAGFEQFALLQEPVAAALSYGFQAGTQKAFWLVYDFGGGTFDAALVKAEDGSINVVNHGGDNYLGGSDIDAAIVDKVLVPRLLEQNKLENFSRENHAWKLAYLRLQHVAELAKIELSRVDKTTTEQMKFKTPDGDEIEFDCELTVQQVIRAARPSIQKSVEIARRVYTEKNVDGSAIERVILVGGPTLAPYFRDILKEELGLHLDFSEDPLTVVARGAAIFAGTQPRVANAKAQAATVAAGGFTAELKYKPVGQDIDPMVGIKIADAGGMFIEVTNTKTLWKSGKIQLTAEGTCFVNLLAEKGERNIFKLELFDDRGGQQTVSPDTFNYTIGAVIEEQPLINSLGIGLARNEFDRFFEKGHGLPLKATRDYFTTVPMSRGQSGSALRIPIYEGENRLADRNLLIDVLVIDAEDIPRDLPVGSSVEVRMSMDESRVIHLKAYFEVLDKEYVTTVNITKRGANLMAKLDDDVEAELARLKALSEKSAATSTADPNNTIEAVTKTNLVRDIKENLRIAANDPDAAAKCEKYLLELRIKLDDVQNVLEWPTMQKEAEEIARRLTSLSTKYGTDGDREQAEDLTDTLPGIVQRHDVDALQRLMKNMRTLNFAILSKQDFYWVGEFQWFENNSEILTDSASAQNLFRQGRLCVERNNIDGLRNVVSQLYGLLPVGTVKEKDGGGTLSRG